MENFGFKSQICTTKEQSERLLELGLKKETADMKYIPYSRCAVPNYFDDGFGFEDVEYIPAWSLHRLMEITNATETAFLSIENMYESLIDIIASNIKYGFINKDYLEEKK